MMNEKIQKIDKKINILNKKIEKLRKSISFTNYMMLGVILGGVLSFLVLHEFDSASIITMVTCLFAGELAKGIFRINFKKSAVAVKKAKKLRRKYQNELDMEQQKIYTKEQQKEQQVIHRIQYNNELDMKRQNTYSKEQQVIHRIQYNNEKQMSNICTSNTKPKRLVLSRSLNKQEIKKS